MYNVSKPLAMFPLSTKSLFALKGVKKKKKNEYLSTQIDVMQGGVDLFL